MSAESELIPFIGPDALFKKDFIPPKIVERPKISKLILGTILDAIENNYSSTTAVYGLEGSGKNLLVSKALNDLNQNTDRIMNHSVCIDLKELSTAQALLHIITQMIQKQHLGFDFSTIYAHEAAHLMFMLKKILAKYPKKYVIYLKNIEAGSEKLINKLTALSKNHKNLNLIYTINSGFQRQRLEEYTNLDLKIPIGLYDKTELYQIMSDRCTMAFPFEISRSSKEYLFDMITELNVKVPSSYINTLKQLYLANPHHPFDNEQIIHSVYAAAPESELNLTSFAQELQEYDILNRIFLENIISHMHSEHNVYISYEELIMCYKMSVEDLEEKFNEQALNTAIKKFTEIGCLIPSSLNPSVYFIPFQITQLKEILALSFGKW